MFQWSFKRVSRLFNEVKSVFDGSFQGVSRKL